jgi:hypothetical protein
LAQPLLYQHVKKRTTPPVSALELAATHFSSARGLFFACGQRCRRQASNLQGNGGKQAVLQQLSGEQTLTKGVYPHAQDGQAGVKIPAAAHPSVRKSRPL